MQLLNTSKHGNIQLRDNVKGSKKAEEAERVLILIKRIDNVLAELWPYSTARENRIRTFQWPASKPAHPTCFTALSCHAVCLIWRNWTFARLWKRLRVYHTSCGFSEEIEIADVSINILLSDPWKTSNDIDGFHKMEMPQIKHIQAGTFALLILSKQDHLLLQGMFNPDRLTLKQAHSILNQVDSNLSKLYLILSIR